MLVVLWVADFALRALQELDIPKRTAPPSKAAPAAAAAEEQEEEQAPAAKSGKKGKKGKKVRERRLPLPS